MYSVYIHINKSNNKKYIGITSQKPEKRWGNGKNYKKNTYIRRAIDKYGWDNFEHIILKTNLSSE
jgi:predicted GIY-YIG superfamily endonuclease